MVNIVGLAEVQKLLAGRCDLESLASGWAAALASAPSADCWQVYRRWWWRADPAGSTTPPGRGTRAGNPSEAAQFSGMLGLLRKTRRGQRLSGSMVALLRREVWMVGQVVEWRHRGGHPELPHAEDNCRGRRLGPTSARCGR